MITLTERDIAALRFIGNWRFATLEQLQKTGIFTVSRKRAYNRLLQLCRDGYLQATVLGRGQICYRLTAKGGEAAGYADPYWSRRYQNAGRDVVLKALTALDFALATGVEYISKKTALDALKAAAYDTLKSCLRGDHLYYLQDNVLHVLTIDINLTLKYIAQKIRAYSHLPSGLWDSVALDFLVFSEARQKQITAMRRSAVTVTAIRGNWKY